MREKGNSPPGGSSPRLGAQRACGAAGALGSARGLSGCLCCSASSLAVVVFFFSLLPFGVPPAWGGEKSSVSGRMAKRMRPVPAPCVGTVPKGCWAGAEPSPCCVGVPGMPSALMAFISPFSRFREDLDQEEKARFGELCSGEDGKGREWFARYVSAQVRGQGSSACRGAWAESRVLGDLSGPWSCVFGGQGLGEREDFQCRVNKCSHTNQSRGAHRGV